MKVIVIYHIRDIARKSEKIISSWKNGIYMLLVDNLSSRDICNLVMEYVYPKPTVDSSEKVLENAYILFNFIDPKYCLFRHNGNYFLQVSDDDGNDDDGEGDEGDEYEDQEDEYILLKEIFKTCWILWSPPIRKNARGMTRIDSQYFRNSRSVK